MALFSQARRRFVQLILSALAAFGLWRFLTPRQPWNEAAVTVAVEDVPLEGALVLPEVRIAVMKQADGACYALDLTCTHLGCTVAVTEAGLVCPCHGSRFDRQGRPTAGPAPRPLQRLQVVQQGGELAITRQGRA